jgi:hypothetical protein
MQTAEKFMQQSSDAEKQLVAHLFSKGLLFEILLNKVETREIPISLAHAMMNEANKLAKRGFASTEGR